MVVFPRESIAWKLEEVTMLRRLSLSLPWYGILVGCVARGYRWLVLVVIAPAGIPAVLTTVAVGVMLLCALAAGHQANFTLGSWRWRAPLLGVFVALGEGLVSIGLTAIGQERIGRAVATFADWPGASSSVLISRVLVISLFAAALAAVVTGLRRAERE
jgi:hypothetical protein